jgi:hypothetical protein
MPAISTLRVDNSMKNSHHEPLQASPRPHFNGEEIRRHNQLPMSAQKLFPGGLPTSLRGPLDSVPFQADLRIR